jgi:hypothetical protein
MTGSMLPVRPTTGAHPPHRSSGWGEAPLGDTPKAVLAALQAQFRSVDDIDNEEMLDVFEDVVRLQTKVAGKLPLTLVVLDEMQQYINEDNKRDRQLMVI